MAETHRILSDSMIAKISAVKIRRARRDIYSALLGIGRLRRHPGAEEARLLVALDSLIEAKVERLAAIAEETYVRQGN